MLSHESSTNSSLGFAELIQIVRKHKLNLLYTVLLCVNQLALGVQLSILGTTLVDLSYIYAVTINRVSYVFLAANIGFMCGSFNCFLYKWINRQLVISFAGLLAALTIALVPNYRNFPLALSGLALFGFCESSFESGINVWIVDMWPVGYPVFLQVSQFMIGLGQILGPILVAPFVHGKVDDKLGSPTNETVSVEQRISDLTLPFGICGLLSAFSPIVILILFAFARYNDGGESETETKNDKQIEEAKKDKETKKDEENVSIPFRPYKLLLCILGATLIEQTEVAFFEFSPTMFQQLSIEMSAKTASHVVFVLYLTLTLGRLVCAFVSLWAGQETIVCIHYTIVVAGLALTYFGQHSLALIYTGTAILGYGLSAMYPSLLSFVHQHLSLTDRSNAFISFSNGCLSALVPLCLSYLLETSPQILFFLCIGYTVGSALLMAGVWSWIVCDRRARDNFEIQSSKL